MKHYIKDRVLHITEELSDCESYKVMYKMPDSKEKKRDDLFIKSCLIKTKRRISIFKYGEEFAETVSILFNHLVIWYPYYDKDMADNREINVPKMTLALKNKYQKIRNLFLNVE